MAKPRNKLIDLLVYFGIRTVAMCFHSFPVEANLAAAKAIGGLWFKIGAKHRQRALENLQHAFPELSRDEHLRLTRQSMENLAMFGVEMLFTTRLIRLDTWAQYCQLTDFRESLGIMLKRNQGVIMLTGHYGNWEILGYLMACLGFESTNVFRPLDNPYVNQWVLETREAKGQRMVAKKGATSEVEDILARGGAVGFIADQNAGKKGLFVDFFGRKASTYKSIGLLAMAHNVPVVIGYARRAQDGRFFFTLGVTEIIYPQDWENEQDPLRYITQRYTKAIEKFVREEPAQYLWVHRRWKTRPKDELPTPA